MLSDALSWSFATLRQLITSVCDGFSRVSLAVIPDRSAMSGEDFVPGVARVNQHHRCIRAPHWRVMVFEFTGVHIGFQVSFSENASSLSMSVSRIPT